MENQVATTGGMSLPDFKKQLFSRLQDAGVVGSLKVRFDVKLAA
jgi:hypothetical protein